MLGLRGRAARAASSVSSCTLVVLFSSVVAAGCAPYKKVSEDAVDSTQKATAQALAERIYKDCNAGRFEPLGDEATPEMRDGLTPDLQKSACAQTKSMFGDFQSLDYAETWKAKGGLFVYRFKGHFSKGSATPEIRVVLDEASKLSGFWLKPWNDELR